MSAAAIPQASKAPAKQKGAFSVLPLDSKNVSIWIYFGDDDHADEDFKELMPYIAWDGEIMESSPPQTEFSVPEDRKADAVRTLKDAGYQEDHET